MVFVSPRRMMEVMGHVREQVVEEEEETWRGVWRGS